MIIEIDDREPKKMIDLFRKEGLKVVRRRLKVGDYVSGDACIERKEINDFCASIIDGRLSSQLVNMKKKFARNYVIVIGGLWSRSSKIHVNCILGKMASVVVKYEVPILMVDNDTEAVYLMRRLFERIENAPRIVTKRNMARGINRIRNYTFRDEVSSNTDSVMIPPINETVADSGGLV